MSEAAEAGPPVKRGYLLLADISGYTEFLTSTELEHAHAIISELTKLIRQRLTPPLRFVKLEGDAVLCYAETPVFGEGERLIELVESCYYDFGNRIRDMALATTCRCEACEAIPTLDLKFIGHFGEFLVAAEDGMEDLSGSDVILAHRMMKNGICEQGGPEAYAFLSGPLLERLPEGFTPAEHRESYDSFGEITGGVHDLGAAAERRRSARDHYVASDDADYELSSEPLPFPASIIWQYAVEADKRMRWQPREIQTGIETTPNDEGRIGLGTVSHCAHGAAGDALREFVDFHPYDYFTYRWTPLPDGPPLMPRCLETIEFTEREAGSTTFTWRIKLEDRSDEAIELFANVTPLMDQIMPTVFNEALPAAILEDGFAPVGGAGTPPLASGD